MNRFADRIECAVIIILTSVLSLPLSAIPQNEKKNALNMDFSGLQRSSNKIDFTLVDDANVLGFDGLLNREENLCGTSFEAPRVAWLIALWEASRYEEPPEDGFCSNLCKRLKKIRPMLLRDMYKTLFYPLAFLKLQN